MTRRGHYKTGIGLSLCAASIALWVGYSLVQATIIMVMAIVSAALPDTMEIKWWRRGVRHSVIPHRTLTHWLAPWLAACVWITWIGLNPYMGSLLFGVAAGATGHILMDWLTPMGVPVMSPFRRHSLRLIHSGHPVMETGVSVATFIVGIVMLTLVL